MASKHQQSVTMREKWQRSPTNIMTSIVTKSITMIAKRDINRPQSIITNTIEALVATKAGTISASITIIVGTKRNITIDATLGLAQTPHQLRTLPTP